MSRAAELGYPRYESSHSIRIGQSRALALAHRPLDLVKLGALHFREPDPKRFPCLQMAYDAGRAGGTLPTVLNGANEVAVERFLRGGSPFPMIEEIVGRLSPGTRR